MFFIRVSNYKQCGHCIIPHFVRAHFGVKGNNITDRIAKRALNMTEITDISFGKGEGKTIITSKTSEFWQKKSDEDSNGGEYYRVQKTVRMKSIKRRKRREKIVLSRISFDHTSLNKTLSLLGKVDSDICGLLNVI